MYEYRAIIVSVHDGDTFRADVRLGMRIWLHAADFRMYGINAPELATPEGPPALAALLTKMPIGSLMTIRTMPSNLQPGAVDKLDKYGRWLGTVISSDGTSVNDWMVTNGHAVVYLPTGTAPDDEW